MTILDLLKSGFEGTALEIANRLKLRVEYVREELVHLLMAETIS